MAAIAGLDDIRKHGPPADIGLFQFSATAMVFQFNFSGTAYTVAMASGVSGWMLIAQSVAGADDVEINAAIDYVGALGGGCVVLLEGIYNTTAWITIDYDNFTFQGMGQSTVIRIANGANVGGVRVGSGVTQYDNVILRDFEVDGNRANQTGGTGLHGISIENAKQAMVDNIHTHDNYPWEVHDSGGSGISVYHLCEEVTIQNCYVYDTGDRAIQVAGTGHIIVNNYTYNSYDRGISLDVVEPDTNRYPANKVIVSGNNCVITRDGSMIGNTTEMGTYFIIENNYIEAPTNSGIRIFVEHATISGNEILDPGTDGIFLYQCGWLVCDGNYFEDVGQDGIDAFGFKDSMVFSNNIFYDINQHGIHFDGTTPEYVTIIGNQFFECSVQTVNTWDVIHLEDGQYFTISGNQIYCGQARHGIHLESGVVDITITGNSIIGADTDGIHLVGASNNLISANTIMSSGAYGIQVDAASIENQIQGNYTQENSTACARINNANCVRNIFTGNCFDEGDISDAGGGHNCVAYLNYDPSAGTFITTINPPGVVGGGGGALP